MELVDTAGIAERLGVKPSTVHQWRQRDLHFPAPFVLLKIGPVWDWVSVAVWAETTGRFDALSDRSDAPLPDAAPWGFDDDGERGDTQ